MTGTDLFGIKIIIPFRVLWSLVLPVGAIAELETIWLMADTLNAMMTIPNLIALLVLSPIVFKLSRDYWAGLAVAQTDR